MVAAAQFPTPAECKHLEPVRGALAHEFAHYDGALGPEGTRRTVTLYGPVIGGMPILAWHCEACGLLKLEYPDGRREERRLYPGPQPGLMAKPSDTDPDVIAFGRQARVSGVSLSRDLDEEITEARPRPVRDTWWRRRRAELRAAGHSFYALSGWTQLVVVLLAAAVAGLLTLGVLAVYSYATPQPATEIILAATVVSFAAAILFSLAPVAFPLPSLAPSPADTDLERPPLPPALKTAVGLMTVAIVFGLVAGVLAVYDYVTSPVEGWLVLFSLFTLSLGLTITVVHVLHRKVMPLWRDMVISATTCVVLAFSAIWTAVLLDYTGLRPSIGFTTLDALLAVAGSALLVVAAVLYSLPTSMREPGGGSSGGH